MWGKRNNHINEKFNIGWLSFKNFCKRTHTHICVRVYTYIYIFIHIHVHIYTHTHTYAYTHTHACTHTYIYKRFMNIGSCNIDHIQPPVDWRWISRSGCIWCAFVCGYDAINQWVKIKDWKGAAIWIHVV